MKDGELRRSRKHDITCDTVDIAVVVSTDIVSDGT